MEHSTASETLPRPLTPHERAILDLLLRGDAHGAAELRAQAEHVQVVATCGCGCGSYDVGLTDYGSIIMLAHDGVLSYLDFHTWDDRALSGLPPADHLSAVSR